MVNKTQLSSTFATEEHLQHLKKKLKQDLLESSTQKALAEIFLNSMSLNDLEKETPAFFKGAIDCVAHHLHQNKCPNKVVDVINVSSGGITRTIIISLNKNIPFLVDSLANELRESNHPINFFIHPIIDVERTAEGQLKSFQSADAVNATHEKESLIYVQLSETLDVKQRNRLKKQLHTILKDVYVAVADWKKMRNAMQNVIRFTKKSPITFNFPKDEVIHFLKWLDDGFFTFLGYRHIRYEKQRIAVQKKLGIFKTNGRCLYRKNCDDPEKDYLQSKAPILITKTIAKGTVHRNVPMDVIRVQEMDAHENILGEFEFIGLFTSTVYTGSVRHFPILRKKVEKVMLDSGLSPSWHDGKALIHILETFPRDELFQIETDHLKKAAHDVLDLQERPELSVFIRESSLGHIVTCLVYVPRERYNADLRQRMGYILEHQMNGQVSASIPMIEPDLPYARVYYTLTKNHEDNINYHLPTLRTALSAASLTWEDHLQHVLEKQVDPERITTLKRKFLNGFPVYYQEQFSPEIALRDIPEIEKTLEHQALTIRVFPNDDKVRMNLKIYHPARPLPLSNIMPLLENMGLNVITEINYKIVAQDTNSCVYLHDFNVELKHPIVEPPETFCPRFEDALLNIWQQNCEDDAFNALILSTTLSWRKIIILRALYRYLKQIKFGYSLRFVSASLIRNASISQQLVNYFLSMFAPNQTEETLKDVNDALVDLEAQIESITLADDDKIFRQFTGLINAILRTNYFQHDKQGNPKPYLSFKFNCRFIPNLPEPHPTYEVFVYAPSFEAVHLRTGAVARGGLRWSDRPEDFRTEILSLMKAQKVKNTVIVPVGAKGGFVIKENLNDLSYEEKQASGIKYYQMMISALLDITDNLKGTRIIKPANVQCYDGDDPYLVVAADKGTATFSDHANAISNKRQFWLGDAFASGGSQGYDHKKMGITARGAWVSVMRHFREMGIDTQHEDFTAVGIGDMSGDVFGNGMLLSKHICLVAAFNHREIFIDPKPDAAKSYAERERLFNLPRSSWRDYNPALISEGGGVFDRKAKKIALTPEIMALLGTPKKEATPDELIKLILLASYDLLWFGGIGTFVKSTAESNDAADDHLNDGLRVNAAQLNCKVIGEGANLGITQKGRIEFSLRGGRINTDAIDNSAGVDCSDHEVNIKILLDKIVAQKKLSHPKRNSLLKQMTDDVAALVLRNNYLQTQAISIIKARSYHVLERQGRFMRQLESVGILNRQLEYLPEEDVLEERLKSLKGLTRPEIAVLLAYGKIYAYELIDQTNLIKDPAFDNVMVDYFPERLRRKYLNYIKKHPLKRQIITTFAANDLVNRLGPTFINEMAHKTGHRADTIFKAYYIVKSVFNMEHIWYQIESLDGKIASDIQAKMFLGCLTVIDNSCLWVLKNMELKHKTSAIITKLGAAFSKIQDNLKSLVKGTIAHNMDHEENSLLEKGVPKDLATAYTQLDALQYAWYIQDIAQDNRLNLLDVAGAYYCIGQNLNVDWLRKQTAINMSDQHWSRKLLRYIQFQLAQGQSLITKHVLKVGPKSAPLEEKYELWSTTHQNRLSKYARTIKDIQNAAKIENEMLAVAAQELYRLSQEPA